MSWEEIGTELGVRPETAANYANLCETNGSEQLKEFRAASPEMVNPEKTAEIVEAAMEAAGINHDKFMELAAQAGMPAKVASGLLGRLKASYGKVIREGRLLKGKQLADELSGKLAKLVDYLDDYAMSQMSGKDLTIAIGILTEKVLLLEGKPTAVYDVNVSHKLEILMPQFMMEAKRRGLTIDVTPVIEP